MNRMVVNLTERPIQEEEVEAEEMDIDRKGGLLVLKVEDMTEDMTEERMERREREKKPRDERREEKLKEEGGDNDVYMYTKRGEFTCELFKIELQNISTHVNYSEVKKLLTNKLNLKPQKIKLMGSYSKFAFIAFNSEADREAALTGLNGMTWKGRELRAIKARPAADPLILKRKMEEEETARHGRRRLDESRSDGGGRGREEDTRTLTEQLNDKVAPFWRLDYKEQLKRKDEEVKQFLITLLKNITRLERNLEKVYKPLYLWFKKVRSEYDRACCLMDPIRPSPTVIGYRNKCEFSVGLDKTVGFRLGSYKDGSLSVAGPQGCPIVSPAMSRAVALFEKYIKEVSSLAAFNNETHEGFWRQLTVRTSRTGECMLIALMHPQTLTEEQLTQEKTQLKGFFDNQTEVNVTSLYFQLFVKRGADQTALELLSGDSYLKETLMPEKLEFRISPNAFFQINTAAAEVCYQTISELVQLTPETILLDICCGTGTIGLCLASKVKKVIGIEINAEAVSDAKMNAELNGIKNAEFIKGRAEEMVCAVVKRFPPNTDLVAIIDPPRAGLNASVVKSLRGTEALKTLVYVSCEPRIAKQNLVDLCRLPSKAYRGVPFVPCKAVPIDMFPQTNHCEVLFLYQRLDVLAEDKLADSSVDSNASPS